MPVDRIDRSPTALGAVVVWQADGPRQLARHLLELGIEPGVLSPGPLNAITDVEGVRVGHRTKIEGEGIRTGVTAIVPHDGNVFQSKVPAAVFPANAFGKAAGFLQVQELGNLETSCSGAAVWRHQWDQGHPVFDGVDGDFLDW